MREVVCVYCGAYYPAIQPFLSVCCPIVPYPSPASALGLPCHSPPPVFFYGARCIPWSHRTQFENILWINLALPVLQHLVTISDLSVFILVTIIKWWWCTVQLLLPEINYLLSYVLYLIASNTVRDTFDLRWQTPWQILIGCILPQVCVPLCAGSGGRGLQRWEAGWDQQSPAPHQHQVSVPLCAGSGGRGL